MPPSKLSIEATPWWTDLGPKWQDVKVKMLVHADVNGAQLSMFGRTTYPAGCTHPCHRHPHGEETLYVLSGRGAHTTGDETFEIGPGDVVFVPSDTFHVTSAAPDEDLTLLWFIGGGGSLDTAGYVEKDAPDG